MLKFILPVILVLLVIFLAMCINIVPESYVGDFGIEDEVVLYEKEDFTLYYYDGEKEHEVAEGVYDSYLVESGGERYIVYTASSEKVYTSGDRDLYVVKVGDFDNPTMIDDYVNGVIEFTLGDNPDEFLYQKYAADEEGDVYLNLYSAGVDGSSDLVSKYSTVAIHYDDFDRVQYYSGNRMGAFGDVNKEVYYFIHKDKYTELYRWNKGDPELVEDEIAGYSVLSGCVVYTKLSFLDGMSRTEALESGVDLAPEKYTDCYVLDTDTGEKYQMSGEVNDLWLECEYACPLKLIACGGEFYMYKTCEDEATGTLYTVEVQGDELTGVTEAAKHVYMLGPHNGYIYYSDKIVESEERYVNPYFNYFMDVYRYRNGSDPELLTSDVYGGALLFDDDSLYAFSEYYIDDDYDEFMTMEIIESDGDSSVIDYVTYFDRLDNENTLVLSEDILYLYRGDEEIELDDEVLDYWTQTEDSRFELAYSGY